MQRTGLDYAKNRHFCRQEGRWLATRGVFFVNKPETGERKVFQMNQEIINVPEIFGSDVFNEPTMKQRLEPQVFCAWKSCIAEGGPGASVANSIAEAMKQWATEKGPPTIHTGSSL